MYPVLEFERRLDPQGAYVPLAVRMKLDLCGYRISLAQWRALDARQKKSLLLAPAETSTEIDRFARMLIDTSPGATPEEADCAAWVDPGPMPRAVAEAAAELSVEIDWRRLGRFDRYVFNHLACREALTKFRAAAEELCNRTALEKSPVDS